MPITASLFKITEESAIQELRAALADNFFNAGDSPDWVRELELALAEYDRGDRSEAQVRELMRGVFPAEKETK